jgi:hypothetical protein
MGETNSPSVAHVGDDISSLSRVKFKMITLKNDICCIDPTTIQRSHYLLRDTRTILKRPCFNLFIIYMYLQLIDVESWVMFISLPDWADMTLSAQMG